MAFQYPSSMEPDNTWLNPTSFPSQFQPPSPLGSPSFSPWNFDDRFLASNPNADYCYSETSSFPNPSYHSTESLTSALASLGLSDGHVRRSPYNIDAAAATASVMAYRRQIEELRTRASILYSNLDLHGSSSSTTLRRYLNGRKSRPNLEIDASLIDLSDLRGRLVSQAKEHNGSRSLHAKIQEAKEEEIEMVLSEVMADASDLMTDVCGHYFMQKLIDVCNEEQRSRLLLSVIKDSRQLNAICCHNHGTRCIQSLLEKLDCPRLISRFMLAIRNGVVDLIKDSNGYHVIRHCLDNFSPQQNKYISSVVVENCFDVARHISGCRVINQCIDKADGEDRVRLLSDVIQRALPLSQDCYGNYVVQHVLDLNNAQLNSEIWNSLRGCFASLSYNKFGSHVVEKLLTANDFYQSSIIDELVQQSRKLLVHEYGNYVIQAALKVAQGDTLRMLFAMIEKNVQFIRSDRYGKKVLEAYERRKVAAACINMYDFQAAWKR